MKRKIVFIIIELFIIVTYLMGEPKENIQRKPIIEESMIPLPDIHYELPEKLIGEFIMISPIFTHELTIFPNNKFIQITEIPDNPFNTYISYGHIVKNDNKWFLSPISKFSGYIDKLTEILITDTGFSYYLSETGLINSMRKENIPIPVNLDEEIIIPQKISKKQYFVFYNFMIDKIDYNKIIIPFNGYYMSFSLQIERGIVEIYTLGVNGKCIDFGPELFKGFIEKTGENTDKFKRIIKFTNGSSYYYIKDGTAEIEISNDNSIIITMFYSPRPETLERTKIINWLRFPAKLILEF